MTPIVIAAAAINIALAQPIDRVTCLNVGATAYSVEGERATVVEADCRMPEDDNQYVLETHDGIRFHAAWPFLLRSTGNVPPGHDPAKRSR